MNRLFQIVYLLLEKKTMTAKQLAEKFEVSTRTIYRDIEILSSANIPVYCNKGKNGGIQLLEGFILNKSVLSEKEQNEILAGLEGLQKLNCGREKETLEKMSTLFQRDTTNWIEIDLSSWSEEKEDSRFERLKQAILEKKRVEFVYYNTKGESRKRKVEPLQMRFKDKSWYLIAYCIEKREDRMFKIQRIEDLRLLEESFSRKLTYQEEKKKIPVKIVELELEIKKEMAYRVYDEFKKDEIKKIKNGDFLVSVSYPESDWIYGYLMSFGEWIEVVSPEAIRIELNRRAQQLLKNNEI